MQPSEQVGGLIMSADCEEPGRSIGVRGKGVRTRAEARAAGAVAGPGWRGWQGSRGAPASSHASLRSGRPIERRPQRRSSLPGWVKGMWLFVCTAYSDSYRYTPQGMPRYVLNAVAPRRCGNWPSTRVNVRAASRWLVSPSPWRGGQRKGKE